jgi:hypothetical protein
LVAVLHGVTEADVADQSPRLAVAAIPGEMVERLANLLRSPGPDAGSQVGPSGRPVAASHSRARPPDEHV